MKGQSPIALGDSPIGAKIAVGLNPGCVPVVLGSNVLVVTAATVTAGGPVARSANFFSATAYPDEILSGFGTGKTAIWAQNTITGAWWGHYNAFR